MSTIMVEQMTNYYSSQTLKTSCSQRHTHCEFKGFFHNNIRLTKTPKSNTDMLLFGERRVADSPMHTICSQPAMPKGCSLHTSASLEPSECWDVRKCQLPWYGPYWIYLKQKSSHLCFQTHKNVRDSGTPFKFCCDLCVWGKNHNEAIFAEAFLNLVNRSDSRDEASCL